MSGFLDDLNDEQKATLEKFRENLRNVLQPKHDDAFLLRWLRARKFNLSKAEKMLRDHFEFRIKYDCDNILANWKAPEVLEKHMIGGLFGKDKDGHPVWYDPYGCLDTKGIFYSTTRQDFLKYKIIACELIQQVVTQQSKKEGRRIETINVIFDLDHASWSHVWKPFIDRYTHVLTAYEANYPESLRRGIVINAPKMFTVGFQLIKPFLSEETKEKVVILGSSYKETLREFIHPDELPVHYGGRATDERGDPKCGTKICYGGTVPSSYYLNRRSSKNVKEMNSCVIAPGSFHDEPYEVSEPGSYLKWDFETKTANIAFGIFLQQNGLKTPTEIVPMMKCECHMVPECGGITCKRAGKYIVRFDNSYSWIKSKRLFYLIEVFPPDC